LESSSTETAAGNDDTQQPASKKRKRDEEDRREPRTNRATSALCSHVEKINETVRGHLLKTREHTNTLSLWLSLISMRHNDADTHRLETVLQALKIVDESGVQAATNAPVNNKQQLA